MAKIKNARLKENTWIVDRAVPHDLRPIIGNSRWRISLKTGDVREASIKAARQNADLDELIKFYRALSPETIETLRVGLGRCGLPLPNGSPNTPSLSQASEALNSILEYDSSERRAELEVVRTKALFDAINESRKLGDWTLGLSSGLYAGFVDRVMEAEKEPLEAARKTVQRNTPRSGVNAARTGNGSLGALIEPWSVETNPAASTVVDFQAAVRRFEDLHGYLSVDMIQRGHVAEFKAALFNIPARLSEAERALPLSDLLTKYEGMDVKRITPATVRKQLGAIKVLLGYAIASGLIDANPASGVTVAKGKRGMAMRYEYGRDDLETIAKAAHSASGDIPWMTRLAMATGARAGELITLTTKDVKQHNGIVYLTLTSEGEGKSLKTDGSRRVVPVHTQLAPRLLEYIKTRNGRLFDAKPDGHGRASGIFSKKVNRWLKRLDIAHEQRAFHSLRHSFKSMCRAAYISEDVHDRLTGHVNGGVGRGYGEFDITTLSAAVEKIELPKCL